MPRLDSSLLRGFVVAFACSLGSSGCGLYDGIRDVPPGTAMSETGNDLPPMSSSSGAEGSSSSDDGGADDDAETSSGDDDAETSSSDDTGTANGDTDDSGTPALYWADVSPIIYRRCSCHTSGDGQGRFDIEGHESFVRYRTQRLNHRLVDLQNPERSYLWGKLGGEAYLDVEGAPMPNGTIGLASVDPGEYEILREWIFSGAQ